MSDEDVMQRLINIRAIALLVVGLALALFLSAVVARTDVIAIVDTGDRNEMALVGLALLDASGTAPVVPAGTGDNYAVALNTEDGTTLAETAFLITYAASGVVDQTNAAVAYSSCDSCRTFAAAIEVVLVPANKADIVTPTNLAAAVNEDCLSCETAAFATQIVLGVDGPVGFTEEGNEQLEQIQEDLQQLEEDADELTLEELKARYDEIVARLEEVLANELVPIWEANRQNEDVNPENTIPGETTSETPSTTESTEPEETGPETTEEAVPEQTVPEQEVPEATTSASPQSTAPEQTTSASPQPSTPERTGPQPGSATSSATATPEEKVTSASPAPGGSTTP